MINAMIMNDTYKIIVVNQVYKNMLLNRIVGFPEKGFFSRLTLVVCLSN